MTNLGSKWEKLYSKECLMVDKDLARYCYDELLLLRDELFTSYDENLSVSEQNLHYYLKLRQKDLRTLQNCLTLMGLSSLGRSQGYILNSIEKNLSILAHLLGKEDFVVQEKDLDFNAAQIMTMKNIKIFEQNSRDDKYKTKIMVTLPSNAAYDDSLIPALVGSYASVLRVNTAHDSPKEWKLMAQKIKEANAAQNKDVKIYVDLAGPKNRTSSIVQVLKEFKIGSKKNPEMVQLVEIEKGVSDRIDESTIKATLAVESEFYRYALQNEHIELYDENKGKIYLFEIVYHEGKLCFAANKKVTINQSTTLSITDYKDRYQSKLYNFVQAPQDIFLFCGDRLVITPKDILGQKDYGGYDAIIGCSNKEVFEYVNKGDEIFIDDGAIGCRVLEKIDLGLVCEVIIAKPTGKRLKEQKGINFPSSNLKIDAITKEDIENIKHTIEYVDIYGISFAQSANDVIKLQQILKEYNKEEVAIVPKIETKAAIENLGSILVQLLQSKHYGLMIARGDLAIEAGFENLAYIQEEIFDMCEAAHVPVIYATQILEGKMKSNIPSRAEITDAAYAQRADCVMLNKGPFVLETLEVLKHILRKMHRLFQKNRQLLSPMKKI